MKIFISKSLPPDITSNHTGWLALSSICRHCHTFSTTLKLLFPNLDLGVHEGFRISVSFRNFFFFFNLGSFFYFYTHDKILHQE